MLQLYIETATSRWLRNSKQRRGMTRTGRLIDLDLFPCWYLELPTFSSFDTFQSSQLLYFGTCRKSRPRSLWLLVNSLLIRLTAFGASVVASLSQPSPKAERKPRLFFLQPHALWWSFVVERVDYIPRSYRPLLCRTKISRLLGLMRMMHAHWQQLASRELWMQIRFGWIRHEGSTMQFQSDTRLYRMVAEHVYTADRKIGIQQAFGRDCYVYRGSGYYAERPWNAGMDVHICSVLRLPLGVTREKREMGTAFIGQKEPAW